MKLSRETEWVRVRVCNKNERIGTSLCPSQDRQNDRTKESPSTPTNNCGQF